MDNTGITQAQCELRARRFRVLEDGSTEWLEDLGVISSSEYTGEEARELHEKMAQAEAHAGEEG